MSAHATITVPAPSCSMGLAGAPRGRLVEPSWYDCMPAGGSRSIGCSEARATLCGMPPPFGRGRLSHGHGVVRPHSSGATAQSSTWALLYALTDRKSVV